MVLEKQITVYVDETTGKEYKSFKIAQRNEITNKKKALIHNISKELGFHKIGYDQPEDTFYKWLIKNSDKVTNSKLKWYIRILEVKMDLFDATSDNLEDVEKTLRVLYNLMKEDIQKTKTYSLKVYLDETLVVDSKINNYSEGQDLSENYSKVIKEEEVSLTNFEQEGEIIKIFFETINLEPVMRKTEALIKAGIKEWKIYQDYLYDYIEGKKDEIDLTDEETYLALEAGGVDNWNGYDYAMELAQEDDVDFWDLSNEERLIYLESAGVDNWSYYSESINEAKEEQIKLTEEDYEQVALNVSRGEDLTKWENYSLYQGYLYGK